jgi:hypothetical protein
MREKGLGSMILPPIFGPFIGKRPMARGRPSRVRRKLPFAANPKLASDFDRAIAIACQFCHGRIILTVNALQPRLGLFFCHAASATETGSTRAEWRNSHMGPLPIIENAQATRADWQRRALMQEWTDYCTSTPGERGKVMPFAAAGRE